ncbi:hypothetical protein RRG08_042851 [Elysia crispata]|uniref:Uncharacterized protein n=1 Tax=Elysia crispata TaxID=231223 RepID=A0AAE1AJZ9_9GAST|nr:hypothetical protein RRG08_042851 [Elysia crispata]
MAVGCYYPADDDSATRSFWYPKRIDKPTCVVDIRNSDYEVEGSDTDRSPPGTRREKEKKSTLERLLHLA